MSRNTNIIAIVSIVIISLLLLYTLFERYEEYNDLIEKYNGLVDKYNELGESYKEFRDNIFLQVEENNTAVTIEYYTNFSRNQQTMTLSVPYEEYNASHFSPHPYWGERNLTSAINYITSDEPIINQIVETIKEQTQSEEELANALLDFVQDKQNGLSIRYYPTNELKYPIETLVEMGGDCDTHAFLYGTLMKSAGFKGLILLSKEEIDGQPHVATAIHLENPPEKSLSQIEDKEFTYNGEKYYYTETTHWNWRVGDLPPFFSNLTFYMIPV